MERRADNRTGGDTPAHRTLTVRVFRSLIAALPVAAAFAVVALTAGPATAAGPPDCLTPTQTVSPQTIVGDWNCAALVEVRASRSLRNGPPIVARALAITHTCMYDAWAAYDSAAVGTVLGAGLRRPAAERTTPNK